MFTTVVSNLQTILSGRFLLTSFFPMLAFWFAHAIMLFLFNEPFHVYILGRTDFSAGLTGLLVLAGLIGVAVTAYAESALLPAAQSVMEGNWPARLVHLFSAAEMNHYERLNKAIDEARRLRGPLGTIVGGQTQAAAWQGTLRAARIVGNALGVNTFTSQSDTAKHIRKLAALRRHGRAIPADEINTCVVALTLDLRSNNADRLGPEGDSALEEARQLLWNLIDYADQYAATQYRSLTTRLQFRFGDLPLAPTRMGNVARSVQSYGIARYEFNFELLWSRLQLPAQKDKDFAPLLQSAKTQLDFLISCSMLTLLWTVLWGAWLLVSQGPAVVFLCVALSGPLISYAWYRAAVAQYRTLADVLRAAIDLFRFDLLTALHYPIPGAVQEERTIWNTVDALHALFELHDLRYVPPKSP